jgi:hypothetical protein
MLSADGNKPTGKLGQRKRKGEGKKAAARRRQTAQEAAQKAPQPDQSQDTTEAINPSVAAIEDAPIGAPAHATSRPDAATASAAMTAIEAVPVEALPADSSSAASESVSATDVSTEISPAGLAAIDWSPAPSPEAVSVAPAEPAPVVSLEAVSVASLEGAPVASAQVARCASAEAAAVSYQTIANAYGDLTRRSLDQTTSFFEKFWGVRSLDKVFELQTEFARQVYDNFVAESQRIRELHRELAKQRLERWEGFVGMTKAR